MYFGSHLAHISSPIFKMDTFFEFSDRLESIMAKAYIWR